MIHPILTLALAFLIMSGCWLVSLWLSDVGIVDILWAPGFAVVAFACAIADGRTGPRAAFALALVSVWAVRLGVHLLRRRLKLGHEDYRYANLRKARGPSFRFESLFSVFWLQALLLWIISWPLQSAVDSTAQLGWVDLVGAGLTLAGIAIEGIADMQLTRFRSNPENRAAVLNSGLWAWSRHPNYFGDFLLWWGMWLLALSGGAPFWVIVSPLLMSALLMHYSGVGLMEDSIADRRPEYRAYIRSTPSFFPRPPKRRASGA